MSGRKSSRTYYISNAIQKEVQEESKRTGASQNEIAERWLIKGKRAERKLRGELK